jgi:hypothetical protein
MTLDDRIELQKYAHRLNALKEPLIKRCSCGRRISANKTHCAEHAQEQRLAELGVTIPGRLVLPDLRIQIG